VGKRGLWTWTLGATAAAAGGWLIVAGSLTEAEAGCAALGGALCGFAVRRSMPERSAGDRLPVRRVVHVLVRLPLRVAIDLALLAIHAWNPPRGRVRRRRLAPTNGAWRGFAALAASLPPGSFAVGAEEGALAVHELVPEPPGPELPL